MKRRTRGVTAMFFFYLCAYSAILVPLWFLILFALGTLGPVVISDSYRFEMLIIEIIYTVTPLCSKLTLLTSADSL